MSKQSRQVDKRRRKLLTGTVAAAGGIAVTAMTGQSVAAIAEADVGTQAGDEEGYRLTQHIADYYKSAAI